MVEIRDTGTHLTCVIQSEDDAWEIFKRAASDEFGDRPVIPEFDGWPNLDIKYWRDDRQAVLTAPMMEGLLEVQQAINRALLLIEEDTSNLRRLSEYQRHKFELAFKIEAGSTEAQPSWGDIAKTFANSAAQNMSGKQLTIVLLGGLLAFASPSAWSSYLDHRAEIARIDANSEKAKLQLEAQKQADANDLQRMQLLADVLGDTERGRAILDAGEEAKEGVLKSAKRVDGTKVGDYEIEPDVAKRMSRVPRAEASAQNITSEFIILRNDTTEEDGFRVRLKDLASEEEFFATLRDRTIAPRDRDVIREAEWEKTPIVATVSVTRRRGEVIKARILSAEHADLGG